MPRKQNKKNEQTTENQEESPVVENHEESPVIENHEDNSSSELKCLNCGKLFKTNNAYLNHINTQVCFSSDKKTYCKVCKIKFDSRELYEQHLISAEHLSIINKDTLTSIININNISLKSNKNNKKTINNIHNTNSRDPYLDNQDKNIINTNKLFNKLTFVYDNGDVEFKNINTTVKFNNQHKTNYTSNTNVSINENDNKVNEYELGRLSPSSDISLLNHDKYDCGEHDELQEEDKEKIKQQSLERQKKILVFLKQNEEREDCDKRFLKLLNKLNIYDYEGLNNYIIKDKTVKVIAKQKYLQAIQSFIKLLIKKKNEGYSNHNNNKIEDIVTYLTK